MDEYISCSDIRNENTQQGLSPYKARYSHCKIKGIVLIHLLINDLESLIIGMQSRQWDCTEFNDAEDIENNLFFFTVMQT